MVKGRENRLLFLARNLHPELTKFLNQWDAAENKDLFMRSLGDFKRLRYTNYEYYIAILDDIGVTDSDTIEVEIYIMENLSRNVIDKGNSDRHRASVDFVIEQFVDVSLM